MKNFDSIAAEALRYLGYKNQKIEDELKYKICELEEKVKKSCSPRTMSAFFTPEFLPDGVHLQNTKIILKGENIKNHLDGAKKVAVLLCTLGSGFDLALMRNEQQSITDATIFNALGSAYIEYIADSAQREMAQKVYDEHRLYSNTRFSPGYGDLPIDASKMLIEACTAQKKIGLTITDDSVLIPRKSVTALLGLFESEPPDAPAPCEICAYKNICSKRKEGNVCGKYKG